MLLPPYSYHHDSLGECLLDLSARFVINCPKEDLQTAERLFFQIEEAHWFYEDFVRVDNPSLPSMKLRTFVDRLFNACPFLHEYQADPLEALTSFQSYKSLIPVRGGIILNAEMNKVLMVKGWRSNSTWGFPKGKINKDEPDSQCAIREVYEECGFDMTPYLKEQDYLEVTRQGKNIRLYVIRGVPEDTVFETQTRKEISKISWHNLNKMPLFSRRTNPSTANYYLAAPFMPGLKKYINKCKGLATSLTSTETQALENVLGGSQGFANDEQAAKNLLTLLRGDQGRDAQEVSRTKTDAQTDAQSQPQSDTAILLNLIKGDHKTTDLESAQQVLGLYAQQSDVPSVEPTKIVLPAHYQQETHSPALSPPLPPSSMLKDLVSARQNTHKGAGLLSILSREPTRQPEFSAPKSNNLLNLLQPSVSVDVSASRRGQADDLMALLEKPKPKPKPEEPKPEEPKPQEPKPQEPKPQEPKPQEPKPQEPKPQEPKPQEPKPQEPKPEEPKPQEPKPQEPKPDESKHQGQVDASALQAQNSLMDLLNPGQESSKETSKESSKKSPASNTSNSTSTSTSNHVWESQGVSANSLLDLLHGAPQINSQAESKSAQAHTQSETPQWETQTQPQSEPVAERSERTSERTPHPNPVLAKKDDSNIGILDLLQKTPNKDPYPAHDFLLEYLSKAIS